jgi:hypothetical protein
MGRKSQLTQKQEKLDPIWVLFLSLNLNLI